MSEIGELLIKLKELKEIKLYKYNFSMSGALNFYIIKKYKSDDGEEIERSVILTNIFGVKYILTEMHIVGTSLIREKLFLVNEYKKYDDEKSCGFVDVDIVKEYSFSKLEAMNKIAKNGDKLYFVDKSGNLYGFYNNDENKKSIELLISNGLITEFNGKEKENGY